MGRMGNLSSGAAKASWRILPILGVAYLIAFMDRANIGFAAAQMNEDLKFSATVYGLGGGPDQSRFRAEIEHRLGDE